jgi:hypothetical protein
MTKIDELIKKTVDFLTVNSIGKNKLIRKVFFIDKNRWYEYNKPDDFGDYAPFVAEAQSSTSFVKEQYALWKKRMIEGIPIPKFVFPMPPINELKNVDDFFHGLIVLYMSTGDSFFLDESKKTANAILNVFEYNGRLSSGALPYLHIPLPEGFSPYKPHLTNLSFFCSSSNGIIIEKILDLGEIEKNDFFVKKARCYLDAWINTPSFTKYGFFSDYSFPYDSDNCNLMKSNSNLGFALVKSASTYGGEKHRKALQRLITSLRETYLLENGITNTFCKKRDNKNRKISLIATQAYCKLLLDASKILGPNLKKEATNIMFKTAKEIFIEKNKKWKDSIIEDDGIGDFTILFMIMDLDKKTTNIIFSDIVKRFYLGNGLWRDYSLDTMQKTAHSKYIGGILKYLLCYRAYLNNIDLESKKWRFILQDR